MNPTLVVLSVFVLYFLGYKFYAGYLSRKVFALRDTTNTPAKKFEDDVDFIPTPPYILWGHHYASIAGLGPILGPAVAVIWGWVPALFWVVLGTLFIGAVHDFSALVLSVRANGESIGSLTEALIGKRAKYLFLLIIFFLVSLAMGVFVLVLGSLFAPTPNVGHPEVAIPSAGIMIVAMAMGILRVKKNVSMKWVGPIAFILILLLVYWGSTHAQNAILLPASDWKLIMLVYAFLASVLPVWLLLQSRDFLNSLLLILGLFILYLGFFFTDVQFSAPAIQLHPKNAPSLFPFVFIIIACGAVSGFHSLVSSGTTAKQLQNEKDARFIGYGGMIGESLLGLMAILATTTFASSDAWLKQYGDWKHLAGLAPKVSLFISGSANFLKSLGIGEVTAKAFIAFIVVSFALTSLDSATRLLRYNIEEIFGFTKGLPRKLLENRYISSTLAVLAIGFFAYYEVNGKPAGLALWQLFGTTNQLLGALALLAASVYLYSRGKNPLYTLIPMLFLLIATIFAMSKQWWKFAHTDGATALFFITSILLIMTLWLIVEAIISISTYRHKKVESLDIL
ncbi:MAG: carbon starvation protein A [Candidatus Hydrogenedentota bacterium]|nr:MAG: carbon starvation protein A [Candidatus Hydrogenedentota bacterium]